MTAVIFDIQRNSFVDGPGIRTTVFFKGCNLKCKWCHNPESQNFEKQMMIYKNKCTGCGKCASVCPHHLSSCEFCGKCEILCPNDARKVCGKEYTPEEVLKEVIKDKTFYETSNGGVTFSGGECMLQADFLCETLKLCKENGIHTAIDTAGCVSWEHFEKIMPYADLFLYDVKCFDEQKHKEYTGVSNKLILENLKKISDTGDKEIIIRIPVIHGVNDDEKEMGMIAEFLKGIRYTSVDLLPYHKMGEHKYDALDMAYTEFEVPDKAVIDGYKKLFVK